MVKGVSRQIIEVNDPKSEYFERALFVLKAGAKLPSQEELKSKAHEYLSSAEESDKVKAIRPDDIYKRKAARLTFAVVVLIIALMGLSVLLAVMISRLY